MKNKLFTLLLAVVASVGTMFAWDYERVQIGDLYYNLDATNQTAEVTSQKSSYPYWSTTITTAIIPASVEYNSVSYSVTSIGKFAFSECRGLASVTIPNSVTSIGERAFQNCTGLTSPVYNTHVFAYIPTSYSGAYTIPDGIESIAGGAFLNCKGLTSVTIPNSVTSIGERAFYGCSGLTSIEIPNSVTSIGEAAFNRCSGLTSIEIPNSVTSIGHEAFYNCTGLTSVTIPNSVTSIEDGAFRGCTGLTSIEIPNSVISIGGGAFMGCDGLTSVTIGNSVTSIGYRAFYYCSGLTSIEIPNSVTSIGGEAFYNCTGLTSVTIPNSVTSIGERAFSYCSGLISINVASDNSNYCSVDGVLFNKDKTTLIQYPGGKQGAYTIPNSVTSIGNSAFYECTGLTSVTIPNSVTSIGRSAFTFCKGLTSIIVENGNSFYDSRDNCNAIIETATNTLIVGCMNTIIPNSVTSIEESAFYGCTGLTSIEIPNSVTSIGNEAFEGCTGLTSVTIPNSVTSIGEYAFGDCTGLTSVTIGNSVTSIGYRAFAGCSGLTSITCEAITPPTLGSGVFGFVDKSIPLYVPAESVNAYKSADVWKDFTNILPIGDTPEPCLIASGTCGAQGDNLTWELSCDGVLTISGTGAMSDYSYSSNVPWYSYRSSIKSVVITDGVTSIGGHAFDDCSGLTSVTIPNSVTSIGKRAFVFCTGLTSVTIPNSVTSIGSSAFGNCYGLTSVTIPNSVTSIGSSAFYNCSGLTSVTIPNRVTSIGGGAFGGCSGLTSVTIPNSVTSIGGYAFERCSGLTSVTIPNSVTSIGGYAFERCSGLTSIEIPNSVTSIGYMAFSYCTGLTSVTIPNSVTSIEDGAFRGCTGLTSINVASDNSNYCSVDGVLFNKDKTTLIQHPGGKQGAYTIPDSVTSIGAYAFSGCSGLTSVTIPNSVTSIGKSAFGGCSGLTSITCEAITPPTLDSYVFYDVNKSIPLYVPAESIEAYQTADQWKDFTNILPQYTVSLFANNPSYGSVIGGGSFRQDTTITIAAIPNEGYRFVQWSDSVKTNPRQIVVTQDTSLTALFELSTFGQCGETAYWQYNENKLYIYGEGDMYDYTAASTPWQPFNADIQSIEVTSTITSVGAYAFAGLSNRKFKEIFLPQGLLSIGKHAFDGDAYLETIDFGANVELIGDSAFNGCSRVASMTCLAPSTPDVGADALTSISSYAELNVLASAIRKYQVDPNWSRFFIQEIGTNTTTVTNDDVTVEPQDNAAIVTWPTNDNAATYTIQITKDGVVFCTLIFNGNGQLTGIAFAPSRDGSHHAPAAVMTAKGMQFTVTGLDSGTHYALTLQAKDSQETVLASYSSEFTTTGHNAPQGFDEISSSLQGGDRGRLILHDGQIYILRGEKVYTLTGAEVK